MFAVNGSIWTLLFMVFNTVKTLTDMTFDFFEVNGVNC
jgi:hypothetical protein